MSKTLDDLAEWMGWKVCDDRYVSDDLGLTPAGAVAVYRQVYIDCMEHVAIEDYCWDNFCDAMDSTFSITLDFCTAVRDAALAWLEEQE